MKTCAALKKELRQEIRRRKQLISSEEKAHLSRELCRQITQLPQWQKARTVLLYHALDDEVSTRDLLEGWAGKKTLLLPVVDGEDLLLKPYSAAVGMTRNRWDILEPSAAEAFTDYQAIDLALIPGMAFDRAGHRLGRGKGYYDRLLPRLSCPTIGLCFPFQKLEKIPVEPWDIPVQRVL
ncbi:MAG: 5-formyltetrahydrofolate cyclo-ligase [Bacteroidales bacterium]|nr:5-formyltetrahydrofolate cyclo-ligase [Bacteroidales bacterium]